MGAGVGAETWVWRQRNARVWENKSLCTLAEVIRSATSFWRTGGKLVVLKPTVLTKCRPITKPHEEFLKLNINVAFDRNHKTMGCGHVLRDSRGRFVVARGVQWSGSYSPKEAEAVAVKEALSWTKHSDLDKVFVEIDSLSVVKMNRTTHIFVKQSISNAGCSEWFDYPPPYLCNFLGI
nr:uncharacterized protein LOC109186242 [Ipomoea trifida]